VDTDNDLTFRISIYKQYSAHQKSGDNLSISYYLPLQHHVLSNLITFVHVQTILFNWNFHIQE